MRNINRVLIPNSLKRNAKRWTKELMDKIRSCNEIISDVPDNFFDKYNKKDVKDALDLMYKNCCCYCEARIGVVAHPHIEHRKPKRLYPDYAYDWDNLHLGCPKCNGFKLNLYDPQNPILDSVSDNPITDHLTYDTIWRKALSLRGKTTIEHTRLNRDELRDARTKILLRVLSIIAELNNEPNDPNNSVRLEQLKDLSEEGYESLIKYAIETFLK